jgi:hypothetical protein
MLGISFEPSILFVVLVFCVNRKVTRVSYLL